MKYIIHSILIAAVLSTSASCSKAEKDSSSWFSFGHKKEESVTGSAFKSLEMKFEDLKAQITGGKTHAERAADDAVEYAAFWQVIAAIFIVVSGLALVFGAALGSQARKVRSGYDSTPDDSQ